MTARGKQAMAQPLAAMVLTDRREAVLHLVGRMPDLLNMIVAQPQDQEVLGEALGRLGEDDWVPLCGAMGVRDVVLALRVGVNAVGKDALLDLVREGRMSGQQWVQVFQVNPSASEIALWHEQGWPDAETLETLAALR